MSTVNITGPEFKDTVHGDGITFAKVDTDAEKDLAGALGISSIPTLMVFRDNVMLYREAGALPAKALDSLIDQVRELDMDALKKQIAEEQAGQQA